MSTDCQLVVSLICAELMLTSQLNSSSDSHSIHSTAIPWINRSFPKAMEVMKGRVIPFRELPRSQINYHRNPEHNINSLITVIVLMIRLIRSRMIT